MTCPPAASFALHRGHRAGVVPALAHVLLVRRVTRVLATVVAAELLARLDLASAPHVLAVHPTSSPAPRRWTPSWPNVVCLPRAVSTSPGSTGSVPSCVHPPPRNRWACPRRREHPIQRSWSIVARSTSGALRESPGVRETRLSRSKKEPRSVPVAVSGELRIDQISYAGPKAKGSTVVTTGASCLRATRRWVLRTYRRRGGAW